MAAQLLTFGGKQKNALSETHESQDLTPDSVVGFATKIFMLGQSGSQSLTINVGTENPIPFQLSMEEEIRNNPYGVTYRASATNNPNTITVKTGTGNRKNRKLTYEATPQTLEFTNNPSDIDFLIALDSGIVTVRYSLAGKKLFVRYRIDENPRSDSSFSSFFNNIQAGSIYGYTITPIEDPDGREIYEIETRSDRIFKIAFPNTFTLQDIFRCIFSNNSELFMITESDR